MKAWLNVKNLRMMIYGGIFVVASLLFFKWEMISTAQMQQQSAAQAQDNARAGAPVSLSTGTGAPSPTSASSQKNQGRPISINTALYHLNIDLNGGNIVGSRLNQYKESLNDATPFALLGNDPSALYYVVESGLVTSDASIPAKIPFSASSNAYTLTGDKPLVVNLSWTSPSGVSITKTYTFYPSQYLINVNYSVRNNSGKPLSARFYGELSRTPPQEGRAFFNSYTNYTGAAISYPDNHYEKISFATMAAQALNQTVSTGWVAMLQHYFITAWIPTSPEAITQFSSVNEGAYSIGLANAAVNIAPGQTVNTGANIYMGPAMAQALSHIAPYLDKTVDYGWLWFISELIFSVMQWIYQYVGNWGFAIILVTVLIKLIFYPLSSKSYRSMAHMRELQPKIAALKEKMGDDRQKLSMSMMELYRKEKVNPLGGCLPILIQIPVFIALYWVIVESVEFRQAPFIGWIHDLSARDPYFILPVLMGISMFVQQRLSPKPPDPMQAKVMMALPFVFTVMFLGFPSGLVLYWFVNNCLSILQQWWVTRQILKKHRKH